MIHLENVPFDKILMDGITDMIFVLEVSDAQKLHYVFIDQSAMKFTGWDEKIIGQPLQGIHSLEEMASYFKKVITERTSLTFNSTFMTKQDEPCVCEVQMTPLFDNDYCTHVVIVTKVIEKPTAMLKPVIPAQLNKLREELNLILRHSSNAILSFDTEGNIMYGNDAACSLTEFNSAELVRKDFSSLVASEYKEQAYDMFHQAVTNKMIKKRRMALLNKEFRRKEVTLKLVPLIVNSSVLNIACIIRDDTENVELINNLKKSQERFKIIAENTDDIITLINEKGKIIYTSPSCRDILGFDYHQFVGKHFLHNIHKDDRDRTNNRVHQAIKEKSHFIIRFRQYNQENNPIWFESHGVPVFDSNTELKHIVVITRDINTQIKEENKLKLLAFHDSLTNLPNRRYFKYELAMALENTVKTEKELALIMLDIDYFK